MFETDGFSWREEVHARDIGSRGVGNLQDVIIGIAGWVKGGMQSLRYAERMGRKEPGMGGCLVARTSLNPRISGSVLI